MLDAGTAEPGERALVHPHDVLGGHDLQLRACAEPGDHRPQPRGGPGEQRGHAMLALGGERARDDLVRRVVAAHRVHRDHWLGGRQRLVLVELMPGRTLRLCSAEDLIVMKLFAGRETDVRDARSVAVRQGARLDWGYVDTHLAEFADLSADPDVMTRLRRLRASVPPAGAPSTCR